MLANYMTIKLLYANKETMEIKGVKRISNISRESKENILCKFGLYYETAFDARGKGKFIDMTNVNCFDIESGE